MSTRRFGRMSLAIIGLVAGVLALSTVPVLAGKPAPKTCSVQDLTSGTRYTTDGGASLQTAISAAATGDTLQVRGRCVGNYTVTNSSLTLAGRATGKSQAAIDGGASGSVLAISGGSITLTDLVITNGLASTSGGGIRSIGAVLTLNGSTSVNSNTTTSGGGGIYNINGSIVLNDSASVKGNTADVGGGIASDGGSVVMNGLSSVTANASHRGGGIYTSYGTIALNGSAAVSGNTATLVTGGIYYQTGAGGGIASDGGHTTLAGSSSVTGNTAVLGGGIYEATFSTLDACSSWTGAISPNSPNDPPAPATGSC